MARRQSELRINVTAVADARVLTADGVLDGTTYRPLRDAIVKAALDEPRRVIVDVTKLTVREDPAWAVFTSARWQVADWPDIPIGLVCAHDQRPKCPASQWYYSLRAGLRRRCICGRRTVRRWAAPLSAAADARSCRREGAASAAAEQLTAQWLTAWSRTDFIHAASTVATELVEDRPGPTPTASCCFGGNRWFDSVGGRATRRRHGVRRAGNPRRQVSGLDLVAATCRSWGSHATANGYTV